MKETDASYRVETDDIGMIYVPSHAAFGAQTQRAVDLFSVYGANRLCAYPRLIDAMLFIKIAAARTNVAIGELERHHGDAIIAAAKTLLEHRLPETFPVHAFHGGGGIATNMNVNEVLANLANTRFLDAQIAAKDPVQPIDHVNLNQSTTDCLSTASHIAARTAFLALEEELRGLVDDLSKFGAEVSSVRKIARTCLQDAIDISAQDYFDGVAFNLINLTGRAQQDASRLAKLNLGGNVVGRSDDCSPAYVENIMAHLNYTLVEAGLSGDISRTENLFAASQAQDPLQNLSSSLDQVARSLIRFCKDLRLMASGPSAGLSEITLPSVMAGSSAIPGKTNPAVPEFVIQCAMMVCGRGETIRMTQDHGELDYNPWSMVLIVALLDMIDLLYSATYSLRRQCVQGMQMNTDRNAENANSLVPSLMNIKRMFGYRYAASVAKQAAGDLGAVLQIWHRDTADKTNNDKNNKPGS